MLGLLCCEPEAATNSPVCGRWWDGGTWHLQPIAHPLMARCQGVPARLQHGAKGARKPRIVHKKGQPHRHMQVPQIYYKYLRRFIF